MRLAAFDTDPGLRTDKLSAELLTLAHPFRRVVGGGENPDTDKGDSDREQRRILIREYRLFVAEDLDPNRRAKDHQNHGGQQPSQPPTMAPRVVSFDQYIDSRIIGKLQLAAMENARPTIKAMF